MGWPSNVALARPTVSTWSGIPTCLGIGPTKTLAMLANEIAKSTPHLRGVPARQAVRGRFIASPPEIVNPLSLARLSVSEITRDNLSRLASAAASTGPSPGPRRSSTGLDALMRLLVFLDLHLELAPRWDHSDKRCWPDYDIAGSIALSVALLAMHPVLGAAPLVHVPGNRKYWAERMDHAEEAGRWAAQGTCGWALNSP